MIRKITMLTIAGCIALVFATGAFASNGTQIGTVGARSTAMGSNFRGLADDWSAVFFNPAGLTQLEGTTIGISGGIIAPRGSYDAYAYPAYPFPGMNTESVDAAKKNFFVPALGIFFKLSDAVTAGLGFYAPFGLGTDWDLIDIPAGYGNATGISKDNEHYSDHQVINIQPTVAFKLSDKISLGLGASYIWGKMDLDMVKLAVNPFAAAWAQLSAGLALAGITAPPYNDAHNRIPVENQLAGDGSAFGFNFGLLFDISDKLSFGISGRYCTDLKLKGNITQTFIYPSDPTYATFVTNLPDIVFASAEDPTGAASKAALLQGLATVFNGQNVPSLQDADAEVDFPLPMTIGAGLAYKASPCFTITADVSMTQWSVWDALTIVIPGEEDLPMELKWKNTFEMGFGFEWMAADNFFLRGGFYTVNTPADDAYMSPTILDPNRRNTITGGIGLNLGAVALNACFEYVLFGEKDITTYEHIDAETGIPENYAGIYNFNAMVITVGSTITL